ncbi:MAG: ribbon-helix-helix protein, CopG family [Deinococcota bacterium]|jgi:predicted DNA-binding protein|nr:ribbon-helix-helix protein, CopG family [Deinococcota bacterium]
MSDNSRAKHHSGRPRQLSKLITVSLSPYTYNLLDAYCRATGRTRSDVMNEAAKTYLKNTVQED